MAGGGWEADFELPDGGGDGHDGDGGHCDGDGHDGDGHDGNGHDDDGDDKMVTLFRPELRFVREVLRPWLVSK